MAKYWLDSHFIPRKSQSLGNRTLKSDFASKIVTACDILVLESMCKCSFFQKTFSFVLMGKLPKMEESENFTNLGNNYILDAFV